MALQSQYYLVHRRRYLWVLSKGMLRGDRIDALMRQNGLSQAELARRVGVSQPTIYKAIKGGKRGTAYLHKIATELNVSAAYLMGETDDPSGTDAGPSLDSLDREALDLMRRMAPASRKALMQFMRTIVHDSDKSPTGRSVKQAQIQLQHLEG